MKTRLQFKPTSMPKIFPSRIVGATRVSRPRLPSHLRDLDGRAPAHPTKSSIWWGPRAAPKPSSRGPALPRHASPMHSSSRHPFLGSGRRSREFAWDHGRRDTHASLGPAIVRAVSKVTARWSGHKVKFDIESGSGHTASVDEAPIFG